MVIHLGFEGAFSDALGELFEKTFFSQDIFRGFIAFNKVIRTVRL
jgi:hypothetical protein